MNLDDTYGRFYGRFLMCAKMAETEKNAGIYVRNGVSEKT